MGTILLSMCKLIERPSKKDGFCFKLYHPLDQSIWAPKGPMGETIREFSFFYKEKTTSLYLFFFIYFLILFLYYFIVFSTAAPIQPLPTSHLIFRVSSQGAGKCWMDALELALKCSSLLIRSMSTRSSTNMLPTTSGAAAAVAGVHHNASSSSANHGEQHLHWNDSDFEKHFKDHGTYCMSRLVSCPFSTVDS